MFSHDTKENQTGIAEIKDADPECVKKCIDLMYTGMPPDLNDNIEQLMHTAHLLQLTSLCEGIWKVLANEVNLETFYLILKLANMYNCTQLCEKCDCFALENFETVYKMEEFGQLDKSYIEKMLNSEEIEIPNEFKLDALLRWVSFNVGARINFLDGMLGYVSLSKISAENLKYFIDNEPLVNENLKHLRTFSVAALENLSIKSKIVEKSNALDAMAVFDKTSGYIQGFNPTENNWIQMHEMNNDMVNKSFSAICVDEYIYVFVQNKSVYRLHYLDKTATWEQVKSMIDDHGAFPPCVVSQNNIYLIGGCSGCSSKSVEMFDSVSNKWVKLADTPLKTDGSQSVVLEDKLYCCGGCVEGQYANTVQCFNSDNSTWINKAPMTETKGYFSAVVSDDKLYVLGGYNGNYLRTVECCDPGYNQRSVLRPMNEPRYIFRSFVINGDIYAVGGFNSRNSIEKYDIGKNEWKDVKVPDNMKLDVIESVKIKLRF